MHLLGQEGERRRHRQFEDRGQLVRGRGDELAVEGAAPRGASSRGWKIGPARTIGPTGCSRYSNEVTMPKLPPPPRIAQKRSGFSSSLAVTISPSRRHHVRGEEVVDRGAVLSHQPADAAAEREARDAGVRDDPADRRQPVRAASRGRARPRARRPRRARCAPPDRPGSPSSARGRSRARRRRARDRRRRGRRSAPPPADHARARSEPRRRRRRRRCSGRCRRGGGRSRRSRSSGPRRSLRRRGRSPGRGRSRVDARRRCADASLAVSVAMRPTVGGRVAPRTRPNFEPSGSNFEPETPIRG